MSRPKILIVENDAYLRSFLTRTLRECGCAVEAVGNYSDGLKQAQVTHFSLCLTDEVLPDGSGSDLCQQIQTLNTGVPVVICYSKEGDGSVAQNAGAQASFKIGDYMTYRLRELVAQLVSRGVESGRVEMRVS